MTTGYVILGHGSRANEANESLKEIAAIVQEKLDCKYVQTAFLGFSKPDLEQAIAKLVEKNCSYIIIMPFFLYKGVHIQEDIPAKLDNLKKKYGAKVSINFARHLGVDERLAEIVIDRIKEVD